MANKIYSRKDIDLIVGAIVCEMQTMEKLKMIRDGKYKKLKELHISLENEQELMSSFMGELVDIW